MKTIKYLFVGALMMGFSAPVSAQTDNKAVIDQIADMLKSTTADTPDQVKAVFKKNKKNGEVLVGIGRAYLDIKDTASAAVYAHHGIKMKYAPAFVLMGDIKALAEDGGGAAEFYDQAIYFDPKSPEAYYKYASVYRKISPSQAISKLEDLRVQRPDIAVDALKGRIYYQSNDFEQDMGAFKAADVNKMEERDIRSFAMSYYFTGKYNECLAIAKKGLEKNSRDAGYNRLAFFSNTELKDFDAALNYADALFNRSDSAKFSYFDYTYYGNALSGAKKHEEAIAMYNKALEQEIEDGDKRAGVVKQLSEAYENKEDYENAIKAYQQFLQTVSKSDANDMVGLAQLYTVYANSKQGEERTALFKNAENVYVDMESKYPQAKEYALFMRARVNTYMDPETKEGLAKPYYEELVSIIEPRGEKSSADMARLLEGYRYLGYYYLLNNEKETSISFWQKIVEIDPTNEAAKNALEALSK